MDDKLVAHVGECKVSLFNVGDLRFDLGDGLGITEQEWPAQDYGRFPESLLIPVQCVLIQTPDTIALVDAGQYVAESGSDADTEGRVPPPSLSQQIVAAGVALDEIRHVVITHAHFDHYNGLTQSDAGGDLAPVFPNAVAYLGRADWENETMQEALHSPESLQASTLGILYGCGQLTLVDSRMQIAPGIEIVPTPGETPGHLAVRLESVGEAAYCVGDLYHHVVEVAMPHWSVTWADKEQIELNRSLMAQSALDDEALLAATHIPGFGRLRSAAEGVRWEPA